MPASPGRDDMLQETLNVGLSLKNIRGGRTQKPAQFGIFGDGKEVPQVALTRTFQKGDFRAGYYRDQTLMMALGLIDLRDMFAHMYADANPNP